MKKILCVLLAGLLIFGGFSGVFAQNGSATLGRVGLAEYQSDYVTKIYLQFFLENIKETDEVMCDFKKSNGSIISISTAAEFYKTPAGNYFCYVNVPIMLLKTLDDGEVLYPVIKVNGVELSVGDSKTVAKTEIAVLYYFEPDYKNPYYKYVGFDMVNLKKLTKPVFEIYQDGVKTGEVSEFEIPDNSSYERIQFPIVPSLFKDAKKSYTGKLVDNGKVIHTADYRAYYYDAVPEEDDINKWFSEDGFSSNTKLFTGILKVRQDKEFYVQFSKPIDIRTMNEGNILLYDRTTGQKKTIDFSKLNTTVPDAIKIVPSSPYNSGRSYYLLIKPGIKGVNGEMLNQEYLRYFKVE